MFGHYEGFGVYESARGGTSEWAHLSIIPLIP